MADDLPPGFTLNEPAVGSGGGGNDLPPGFKLSEPPLSREQEIRRERLQRLVDADTQRSSGRRTDPAQLLLGAPGILERAKGAATSSLMRPIGGLMSVAEGTLKGDPASTGELWRAGVGAEKDYYDQAVANTSKGWKAPLGVAADVGGSLVGGGKATGQTSLLKQIAQSGGQGASKAPPEMPRMSACYWRRRYWRWHQRRNDRHSRRPAEPSRKRQGRQGRYWHRLPGRQRAEP